MTAQEGNAEMSAPPPPPPEPHPVETLVRLALGGFAIMTRNMPERTRTWETQTDTALKIRQAAERSTALAPTRPSPTTTALDSAPPPETELDKARTILLGMVVDTQQRIENALPQNPTPPPLITAMLREYENNPAFQGLREQVDVLAARGEQELERWAQAGRTQEERNQVLFQTAIRTTTETTIHEITTNQEVRQLVRQQSVSVFEEIVEEIREHLISLDLFIERYIRRLFGRRPRHEIPTPIFADPEHPAYIGHRHQIYPAYYPPYE
ncbi:MAG: hypothetical protein HC911_01140 [Chloroflexaceae bacterium]|nr:hypothetical protein [Chloroflexaceae bacterium]